MRVIDMRTLRHIGKRLKSLFLFYVSRECCSRLAFLTTVSFGSFLL
jgi:hypothetical protein